MGKSDRMMELLRAAGACFMDGSDPFTNEWLGEHAVTFDECMGLSHLIGTLCKGYARAPRTTQNTILLCGSTDDVPAVFIEAAVRQVDVERRLTALGQKEAPM